MEVVDFLFPKKKSFHVIGKISPQNTPKKLVLLAGHHDSAYEFPLLSKLGGKSAYLIMLVLIIALLGYFIFAINIEKNRLKRQTQASKSLFEATFWFNF